MDDKNIIIVLLVIIAVILACVLGSMFLPSLNAKEDCQINITSSNALNQGDSISVQLESNGEPVNGKIHFKLTDDKGNVKDYDIDTRNGKANLNLKIDPGNYTVNITFKGDKIFNPASASQKVEVTEKIEEPKANEEPAQQTSNDQSSDNDIVKSREFESYDYYPGHTILENTYSDGDVERYYDDGSYEYYDKENHIQYYKNNDGSSGSMYVG